MKYGEPAHFMGNHNPQQQANTAIHNMSAAQTSIFMVLTDVVQCKMSFYVLSGESNGEPNS